MPPGRVELGGNRRDVDQLRDLHLGADGQPVACQWHAHRRREGTDVGVEGVQLISDQRELACLVGGDQKRHAVPLQECREVRRVDGPQRRGVHHLGVVRVRRLAGEDGRLGHDLPH